MLDNNRAVINGTTGAVEQTVAYYPLSPYLYCGNDPVNFIDKDGRSTWVANIGDGLYQIIGGDLYDKDLNIYQYHKDKDGNYTVRGKSIGQTTSITSFYNSGDETGMSGNWAYNSTIDVNDHSDERFFSNIVKDNPPLFDDYMVNAQNGKEYDFKSQGTNSDHYRGMPFGTKQDGTLIYTSARDIGNIAAGYIAAINGIPWFYCRIAFDGYQSHKSGKITSPRWAVSILRWLY
ncbi:MAG: hypothetical protein K2G85_08530 [Muribaculaceae bacterium]|nr:hypothetical protein [Muribaculaceae bacterium]